MVFQCKSNDQFEDSENYAQQMNELDLPVSFGKREAVDSEQEDDPFFKAKRHASNILNNPDHKANEFRDSDSEETSDSDQGLSTDESDEILPISHEIALIGHEKAPMLYANN